MLFQKLLAKLIYTASIENKNIVSLSNAYTSIMLAQTSDCILYLVKCNQVKGPDRQYYKFIFIELIYTVDWK